ELKELLQLHDGQHEETRRGLIEGWILLGCEGIGGTSRGLAKLTDEGDFEDLVAEGDGNVKGDWWNKAWIPFLESPGGDYLCIDMDPDEGGEQGQIIEFRHDDETRSVRAGSLAALLEEFAAELEDDRYSVDEKGRIEY